jgi:hypothetical protein
MHRFMVKLKTAGIFKGILETWNSTRNPKNFAGKWREENMGGARLPSAYLP